MPSAVPAESAGPHGLFSRANLRRSWVELVAGVVLVVGTAAVAWYRGRMAVAQQVGVGALLLLVLAVLLRRGWSRLFGPVLYYDLVRVSRRSRYIPLRCVYAGLLLLVLYWQYSEVVGGPLSGGRLPRGTGPVRANLMAEFAEKFFYLFMVLQFLLVLVLTPVYAASSIAEEKDRQTLEYLLASDLSNREIVLSKLVSRFATLGLTVLTGLPILSLLQFMGGVDPDLVLAGFAATGLTMISLVSLSTLASVYARKPRDAILLTYLTLAAYLGLGYLLQEVMKTSWIKTVTLTPGANPYTVGDLVEAFNAGNLPLVLLNLRDAFKPGQSLAGLIAEALRGYLAVHALITLSCATWAVCRLRAVALRQRAGKGRNVVPQRRPRIRPRLALQPMVWKEVFVEPGYRLNRLGWVVVGLFVLVSLTPALWVLARYLQELHAHDADWDRWGGGRFTLGKVTATLGGHLTGWVRTLGMVLGCLMLLGVAARASTSISGERDRETLDALLTSPLQSNDILFAKWLGSLLSVRWAWLWLALVWSVGLATRALHPLAVPLFGVAWLVYASTFAGIGLWFSTACRTSMRATLWTLAFTALLGAGHLGVWMCCLPLPSLTSLTRDVQGVQLLFTPPAVLYSLAAAPEEPGESGWDVQTILSYFALFLWALASLFLWTITRSRFRRLTSRMPYRRPELRHLQVSGWGGMAEEEPARAS